MRKYDKRLLGVMLLCHFLRYFTSKLFDYTKMVDKRSFLSISGKINVKCLTFT